MRALIVEDGTQRSALGACRALGRAGWQVGVASPARGFAGRSRFARWHAVPSVRDSSKRFVDAVASVVRGHGYEVVMAAGDPELLHLTELRELIPAAVAHPNHGVVVRALDKLLVTDAARAADLGAPWTATSVPADGPDGPFVVKERLHGAAMDGRAAPHIPVRVGATRAEAERHLREAVSLGGQPIVQEMIDGQLLAVIALLDEHSHPLVFMAQVADRVWPPRAGPSVRATVVPLDDTLRARIHRLLLDLRWTGLVQLQFIVPDDGEPRFIDFNGRIYGSISLAEKAGVPLVSGWAAMATGRPLPAFPPPMVGARYRWLDGDVRRAFTERRGGLVADLVETVSSARGATLGILDVHDPRPGAHLASQLAVGATRNLWSRWTPQR